MHICMYIYCTDLNAIAHVSAGEFDLSLLFDLRMRVKFIRLNDSATNKEISA